MVPDSILAEGVGFEPTRALRPCQFSRLVHSTTLPPLRSGRILADSRRAVSVTTLGEREFF